MDIRYDCNWNSTYWLEEISTIHMSQLSGWLIKPGYEIFKVRKTYQNILKKFTTKKYRTILFLNYNAFFQERIFFSSDCGGVQVFSGFLCYTKVFFPYKIMRAYIHSQLPSWRARKLQRITDGEILHFFAFKFQDKSHEILNLHSCWFYCSVKS